MRRFMLTFAFTLLSSIALADSPPTEEQRLSAEQKKYVEWGRAFLKSLDYKTGNVELDGGIATLNVPDSFYYLSPQDAVRVLVEAWGNPQGPHPLGMLFPANKTPLDEDAWGVVIEYQEDGYVSDADADAINYDELLVNMQESTAQANQERQKNGFESIALIGWAQKPFYDKITHKMHWAKEIKFGDNPVNTLNYNIRVLGRKGYLQLNFVAAMTQLPEIQNRMQSVLDLAEFNTGFRYEEYKPDSDKLAGYGLGALVAGAGALVLAKKGFLLAAVLLLKKFGVFIVIGIAALFGALFKRGKRGKSLE